MSEFQHGLFGCFDNCGICIITYFAPCYTQGRIAEKVGDDCLICGLLQLVPLANIYFAADTRRKVREQKNIAGSFLGDLCMMCCCYCCALTQEAQEVQAIGSMSIVRQ